jgi:hypothetical protein
MGTDPPRPAGSRMTARNHRRLESHVQQAINKHRRSLLGELARDDLHRATASLPEADAEADRAALRRELDEADRARTVAFRRPNPAARARAAGDALFKLGDAA